MNLLYEYARMCNDHNCITCPLGDAWGVGSCQSAVFKHFDEAERVVREWAEAHPEQTYKSYFLARFPNARLVCETDEPHACVQDVFGEEHCEANACMGMTCAMCWNRPYKEDV